MSPPAQSVALELVRFAGLRPARVRADRVSLRCPFHKDRHPSAAVLASGVLVCSAGCGSFSPFDWLVALGRTPAETMALLDELRLRDGERHGRRAPSGSPTGSRRSNDLRAEHATSTSPAIDGRTLVPPAPVELEPELLERLDAARFERRRFDARLGELRGFTTEALELAGVAIGRPAGYGFRGPRPALDELRLLLPVRDARRRPVGLLAIAPNPGHRHEPKVLARPGTPRLPLELLDVDEPLAPFLLVCEGELDAIAAASVGLRVVGVPGIGGYGRHAARIAELVRELALEQALLIADGDDAGRRAFRELAVAIAAAGARAVFADVLEAGSDVGSFLVEVALELGRPELPPGERRREAGRRLLTLATGTEGRCT
jgi:hypothetical protein